jgi:two-component system, sensor histidine kinase and response regulator
MSVKKSATGTTAASAPAPQPETKRQKPLVLTIDDDIFLSDLFRFGLERADFEVLVARDGIEGYELAKTKAPDIILCDVVMPNLDGFGVLQKLKDDPVTKDIPVIMLTSLSHPEDIQRAKEMGAASYMIKSQTLPNETPQKVRSLLKK